MEWSHYQESIFNFVKTNTSEHAKIIGVAGSSKTTTLTKAIKERKSGVLVSAFNKIIREEFAVKTHHPVQTFNSFGWRICLTNFRNVVLNDDKTEDILKTHCPSDFVFNRYRNQIKQLIALMKARVTEHWKSIAVEFDIDYPEKEEHVLDDLINKVWFDSISNTKMMDYNDQIFMPVYHDLWIPKTNTVVIDEYQDTSPAQATLMERAAGEQIIVAGDPMQAIYGWRGAKDSQMDEFNGHPLPLSICYRCPKSVVRLAKEIVPYIEEWSGAAEGHVGDVSRYRFEQGVGFDDYILCRNNAPLTATCLEFYRQRKRGFVLGKEIGVGLLYLYHKVLGNTEGDFLKKLKDYRTSFAPKDPEKFNDKCNTLQVIAEEGHNIPQILSELFSDFGRGPCFMTVHKAKGRQAKKIWILEPKLLKEPKVKYVAITRSQEQLYFVE